MSLPSYDVVIVNYNGKDVVIPCLRALYASTLAPAQVIICDNGSQDGSPELITREFPEVTLIREANIGFGPGNNRGIQETKSPYVLCINNDLLVEPSCVETLLTYLEKHPKVAIVNPLIMRGWEKDTSEIYSFGLVTNTAGFAYNIEALPEVAEPAFSFSGACFLARGEVIRDNQFEPSYFLYYEEPELTFRLLKKGWQIGREGVARSFHLENYSSPQGHAAALAFRQFYGIQNRWFALGKHWPVRLLPRAMVLNLLHELVFIGIFIKSRQFTYVTLVYRAPLSFFRGLFARFTDSPKTIAPNWWYSLKPSSLKEMLGVGKQVIEEKPSKAPGTV